MASIASERVARWLLLVSVGLTGRSLSLPATARSGSAALPSRSAASCLVGVGLCHALH